MGAGKSNRTGGKLITEISKEDILFNQIEQLFEVPYSSYINFKNVLIMIYIYSSSMTKFV